MKKKKLSQGASTLGIFTIELYSFPSKSWIYDTSYGTHICITTQGLRGSKKLKPGALSLYIGDGHRTVVEAIGTYHLELHSGLVIVLNNYHYAPSITRDKDTYSAFAEDIEEHEIIAHRTPSYTPQNNRVSERRNRTLLDMVRSMMSQTTLPKSFLDSALETAPSILNMVPTKKNAEFFESKLLDLKASGSMEDLELIQEEDTNPSIDTSLNHKEDDQEIDEPQSDINLIRKSSRTRRAPDRMCLYIDAEDRELGDLGEPANYKAALLDPEFKKWLDAMNNPGEKQWTAVKNILKYLRNTKDMFLTGYVFVLNGGVVDWKSTKQSIFATSSTDAEYIAAFDASNEAVWIRKFISGLDIVPTIEEPISMY
nr:hypothetical protein [Tanacetum cinerariifolium]